MKAKTRPNPAPEAETRNFKIHPKLLFDVIFRQAGSLAKAILEGIMNSVDAQSTECRIYFDEGSNRLSIVDDGSGIVKKEHIEKFFETFGQPHDESEHKRYGTFRMGRGQLFAFGVNTWRTGPWQMIVDVKTRGLDYDLITKPRTVKGCEIVIELYESLSPSQYQETEQLIRKWARYSPIPVYWNDDNLQTDPASDTWDHQTDEAYIKLNKSGVLSIYNLGIHTMDIEQHRYGTGGVIVSKKQLKVNFARNDVQSDCKVWKKVLPFVKEQANEKNLKEATLTDAARCSLSKQFLSGDISWADIYKAKLITAVNGRQFPLTILQDAYRYGNKLSSCPLNHPLGDKIFQHRLAFMVAEDTLERFGVKTLQQLCDKIKARQSWFDPAKVISFASLTKGMDLKYVILDEDQYRPSERIWVDVAVSVQYSLDLYFGHQRSWDGVHRRMLVGDAPVAGWTDGKTYIALARKFLADQPFNVIGVVNVARLVLHEMCHDEPDTAEHTHTHEFYELYHDVSRELGAAVSRAFRGLTNAIKRHSKKAPGMLLRALDTEHRLEQIKADVRKRAKSKKKVTIYVNRAG